MRGSRPSRRRRAESDQAHFTTDPTSGPTASREGPSSGDSRGVGESADDVRGRSAPTTLVLASDNGGTDARVHPEQGEVLGQGPVLVLLLCHRGQVRAVPRAFRSSASIAGVSHLARPLDLTRPPPSRPTGLGMPMTVRWMRRGVRPVRPRVEANASWTVRHEDFADSSGSATDAVDTTRPRMSRSWPPLSGASRGCQRRGTVRARRRTAPPRGGLVRSALLLLTSPPLPTPTSPRDWWRAAGDTATGHGPVDSP